uniref:Uncharacterized protein n=1 Tax=Ciona intestinalis TaxID=7719 RepID=H2XLB4_CIOIN
RDEKLLRSPFRLNLHKAPITAPCIPTTHQRTNLKKTIFCRNTSKYGNPEIQHVHFNHNVLFGNLLIQTYNNIRNDNSCTMKIYIIQSPSK